MRNNYMKNTVFTIKSTIYGHGRGWCFTQKDFANIDKPLAVRKALSRLNDSGFINRISWGLYEYPRQHKTLGQMPPDISQVTKALARDSKIKILPSGAYAANLLGLSEQVPGKIVYLTDGPSRRMNVGKTELIFKHTTIKNMVAAGTIAGIVIQALRFLGKDHIDPVVINKLTERLSSAELKELQKQSRNAPYWVRQFINNIVSSGIENE